MIRSGILLSNLPLNRLQAWKCLISSISFNNVTLSSDVGSRLLSNLNKLANAISSLFKKTLFIGLSLTTNRLGSIEYSESRGLSLHTGVMPDLQKADIMFSSISIQVYIQEDRNHT